MAGLTKLLPVPYYVQVSPVHCQATVIKMYAQYLDMHKLPGGSYGSLPVQQIWDDINVPGKPDKRANKKLKNAHANIKQWLEERYSLLLQWTYTKDPQLALERIVSTINKGYPVMAGVSHERVEGHIVLIVGYVPDAITMKVASSSNAQSVMVDRSHKVIVHDPYGAFHPALKSELHGKKRFEGMSCLVGGGESGAGMAVELSLYDVSRQRGLKNKDSHGDFNLMALA